MCVCVCVCVCVFVCVCVCVCVCVVGGALSHTSGRLHVLSKNYNAAGSGEGVPYPRREAEIRKSPIDTSVP
jgi:hypothetical protein